MFRCRRRTYLCALVSCMDRLSLSSWFRMTASAWFRLGLLNLKKSSMTWRCFLFGSVKLVNHFRSVASTCQALTAARARVIYVIGNFFAAAVCMNNVFHDNPDNVFHNATDAPFPDNAATTMQRHLRKTYALNRNGLIAKDPIGMNPIPRRRAIVLDGQVYNKSTLARYFDTLPRNAEFRVPMTRRLITNQEMRSLQGYAPTTIDGRDITHDATVLRRKLQDFSTRHPRVNLNSKVAGFFGIRIADLMNNVHLAQVRLVLADMQRERDQAGHNRNTAREALADMQRQRDEAGHNRNRAKTALSDIQTYIISTVSHNIQTRADLSSNHERLVANRRDIVLVAHLPPSVEQDRLIRDLTIEQIWLM